MANWSAKCKGTNREMSRNAGLDFSGVSPGRCGIFAACGGFSVTPRGQYDTLVARNGGKNLQSDVLEQLGRFQGVGAST